MTSEEVAKSPSNSQLAIRNSEFAADREGAVECCSREIGITLLPNGDVATPGITKYEPIDSSTSRNGFAGSIGATSGGVLARSTRSKRRRNIFESLQRWIAAVGLRLAIRSRRRGWDRQAISILRGILELAPRIITVRIWLARALHEVDDDAVAALFESEELEGYAVPMDPGLRSSDCCRIARLHLAMERFDVAEQYLAQAKELSPESLVVWRVSGEFHHERGETDDAIACFEHESRLAPAGRLANMAQWSIAECLASTGRKSDAAAQYRKILDNDPTASFAYGPLVECEGVVDPSHPLAVKMRESLNTKTTTADQRESLHYALGTIYDRHGDVPAAFAHFTLGNRLRARAFDAPNLRLERDRIGVAARCEMFTPEMIANLSPHGCQDDFLICIVGMPRSGTTLLEQILGSHSDVCALGERCRANAH